MSITDSHILVTGGGGFVGSHLVERLLADGNDVRVVDNLSNGTESWIPGDAELVVGDLTDQAVLDEAVTPDIDLVFHLAADKDASRDDIAQFRSNNRLTEVLLEQMESVGVDRIAFTSSSTVYGEAPRPTPEDYAPLEPISIYGAGKLAEEALLSVFGHSHDFTVWNFRFANVVGSRLRGAVVPDFIEKLRDDPTTLEILGDGRQEKSYLYIDDCIDAMLTIVEQTERPVNTFNLGTRTTTSVDRIATIVADEMGVDPSREYTGGKRGWTGDVPKMRLSIEKLSALGWEPTVSSDEAIRRTTRTLLDEL
ncbi:MAG: NAD-dependent epimerase/dehydratase family protein [Halovenus sp.]|uniref:NAD-dependent epimerase/dehydratase family protein n=1 Tax=Halovenus amylolytica TaxID=2500550 RepID=UPI000FE2F394